MSHSISSWRATGRAHTRRTPAQRHLRLAWACVVLIPRAVWFGLKARHDGLQSGFVPAVVGATGAVVGVGANVASYVVATLLG